LVPLLGDLQVPASDDVDVVDGRAPVERLANLEHRGAGAGRGDRHDRLLDLEILDVGRRDLQSEDGDDDDDDAGYQQPHQGQASLALHGITPHLNRPMRERSLKLNQMKNAFPTMFSSGTNPHTRLSAELSRLSPI